MIKGKSGGNSMGFSLLMGGVRPKCLVLITPRQKRVNAASNSRGDKKSRGGEMEGEIKSGAIR